MDDDLLVERLNQLARLAEEHVAAGTSDTGVREITADEADRIIAGLIPHGVDSARIFAVLDRVAPAYRAAIEQAARRVMSK